MCWTTLEKTWGKYRRSSFIGKSRSFPTFSTKYKDSRTLVPSTLSRGKYNNCKLKSTKSNMNIWTSGSICKNHKMYHDSHLWFICFVQSSVLDAARHFICLTPCHQGHITYQLAWIMLVLTFSSLGLYFRHFTMVCTAISM